jgi:hypothetical protein
MFKELLSEENRKKYANYLFYMALTIELVLMVVEKSEISFHLESYVFRVTFLLTFAAFLLLKRDVKEWIIAVALIAFTVLCYKLSGKNDLLRILTFMLAARDIDLKKAMKYSLIVSAVGFALIALLAARGSWEMWSRWQTLEEGLPMKEDLYLALDILILFLDVFTCWCLCCCGFTVRAGRFCGMLR